MRRGFKAWAEREAATQRVALRLSREDPLPARQLAAHLQVVVIGPEQVPGVTPRLLSQLLRIDPSSWSAFTLVSTKCSLIVHNTSSSPARQESDLMHEMAHLLCKHKPVEVVGIDGLPFALRGYDAEHEEEARWLGACLQLPREALSWALRNGWCNADIATYYGASLDQVQYRRNMTGIDRQIAATGRTRRLSE